MASLEVLGEGGTKMPWWGMGSRELEFKLRGQNLEWRGPRKLGTVNGGASGTTCCGPEER